MKIAYFDCFSGISGDMILGALVDAGLNFEDLRNELKKIPVADYEIKYEKMIKKGIACTKVDVITASEIGSPAEMIELVEKSTLEDDMKQKSKKILYRMGEVEAKVHSILKSKIEDVHFHELNSVDTIIDVVGAVIGFKKLCIDEIYSSPLNVGSGIIKTKHGILPAPGPATCELLRGIPVYSSGIKAELTTPTGAAIITTLATGFGHLPAMKIETIGYGSGNFELEQQSNLLRVLIGESQKDECESDIISLIETNIDDLNPQIYEYCFERLFEAGALDIYLTPIIMKKNRSGIILSIIAPLDKVDELINIVFKETTSIGIRLQEIRRKKIKREIIEIETELGKMKVKKVIFEGKVEIIPEYESCKKIAIEKGIPLKKVYSIINSSADTGKYGTQINADYQDF
ncbi:MAG: nickel pincer cofactor biosynthesis protein LarC [bacterium]